jgi:hypothetical protein
MSGEDRIAVTPRADRMTGRQRRHLALALAAILASAHIHAQRLPRPARPADGLIVGRVVDASGRAVPGAVVSLVRMMPDERRAPAPRTTAATADRILTGADGFFVFRDLPLAAFTLTAARPGYADGAFGRRRPGGPSQALPLTDWEPRREVVIQLWKHGAISGTVTDEIGEPLIRVLIQSFARTEVNGVRRFVPSARATTDDRGVYRMSNLLPGEYVIAATSRQIAIPLPLAQESRDRGAPPPTDAALSVTPVPGTASGLQLGDSVYHLPLDGATPPPPQDDRLWIYPPAFHPDASSAGDAATVKLRSGEERDGIDLQLRPARTVRVSGVLAGPADMIGLRRLRLMPVEGDVFDAGEPVTSTDARGAFLFPAVPAGEYSLKTTTRSTTWRGVPERALHWADVPVTVGRDDISELSVTLRPGLIVSGSLVFEGTSPKPGGGSLQRTHIVVERAGGGLPGSDATVSASVDDVGQFSTAGIAAGAYFVRVTDSPPGWMFKEATYNGRDLSEYAVDVRDDLAGIALVFTDRWTGLRGIVTSPSGQTDAAALVLLFPADPSRWRTDAPGARRMRSARVRATGEFSFTSIPPGEYYLAAIADQDGSDWQDPAVLEAVSRSATRLTINDGDQKTVTLRRKETRR